MVSQMMAAVQSSEVHARFALVSPFPREHYGKLWAWMREYPEANFDDYGPSSVAELATEMFARRSRGERTWLVMSAGRPVGAIGYAPMTRRLGAMHGICFTRAVHRTGVPQAGVRSVLEKLWATGVEKIRASYFATNQRIGPFLRSLGFKQEGYLERETVQHGEPMDMVLMALFR